MSTMLGLQVYMLFPAMQVSTGITAETISKPQASLFVLTCLGTTFLALDV